MHYKKRGLIFVFSIVLIILTSFAAARDTNLLNWHGQFYGCGLTSGEIPYLGAKIDGGVVNIDSVLTNPNPTGAPAANGNCFHIQGSKHYCSIDSADNKWKLAIINYDGSTLAADAFIDTEKTNNLFKNLVTNGGFESETIAPWDSGETTTQKNSGAKSLKLSSSTEVKQPIEGVASGKTYILSGYIKVNDKNKLGNGEVVLKFNGISTDAINKDTPDIDSSFVHVSKSIQITGDISSAEISLEASNIGQGAEIYFDDIKLITFFVTSEETSPNLFTEIVKEWEDGELEKDNTEETQNSPIGEQDDITPGTKYTLSGDLSAAVPEGGKVTLVVQWHSASGPLGEHTLSPSLTTGSSQPLTISRELTAPPEAAKVKILLRTKNLVQGTKVSYTNLKLEYSKNADGYIGPFTVSESAKEFLLAEIPVTASKKYRISKGDLKSTGLTSGTATLLVRWLDNNGNIIKDGGAPIEFSDEDTTPTEAKKARVILSATDVNDGAKLFIKDIELTEEAAVETSTSACCPSTYCWDGSVCVKGKTEAEIANEEPYATGSDDKNYYCIKDGSGNAEWTHYVLTGGCPSGFCPDPETGDCVPEGTTRPATIDPENPFLESICKADSDWAEFENQEVLLYDSNYYGCNINPSLLGLKYLDGSVLKDLFGENNERTIEICQLPYNYIKNSGFERLDESNPAEWTGGTKETDANIVIYGTNALKLTSPQKAEQTINFGSGTKDFVIRVWYQGGNIEIKRGKTIKCGCEEADCFEPIAYGHENWKLCQGNIRASEEKTISISPIEGAASIDNVEIFLLDDVETDPKTLFQDDEDLTPYYCTNNGWQDTPFSIGNTINDLKDTPKQRPEGIAVGQLKGCCTADSCWDGGDCKPPSILGAGDLPTTQDTTNAYFCAKGKWNPVSTKLSPDGSTSGFCDDDSNCYVGAPDTDCVEPGTYGKYTSPNWEEDKGDHYCELVNGEGTWTSRTKKIAKALLEQQVTTGDDYSLFCDEKSSSLNNPPPPPDSDLLQTKFNNPYCVLKKDNLVGDDEITVGTALDKDEKDDFLGSDGLGLASTPTCNVPSDADTFQPCSSPDVFYNPKINSIFYTKATGAGGIWSAIKGAIDTILGWFRTAKSAELPATIEQTVFNKVYINKKGAKTIHGLIETKGNSDYMVIEYKSFSADICAFIDPRETELGIECAKVGNNYYITAIQNIGHLDSIWQDLTSKLRITSGAAAPPDGGNGEEPPPAPILTIGESAISITPSPTGATLGWETNIDSIGQVGYGIAPDNYDQLTMPFTPTGTEHEVTLSGLEPGTEYSYKIIASATGGLLDEVTGTFTTTPPDTPPPEEPPTVVSVEPAILKEPLGAKTITVTFSKDIKTNPTIKIDGAPIDGASIEKVDEKTLRFGYDVNEIIEKDITLVISGAVDTDDKPMAGDWQSAIKIDTKKPTISSVSSDGIVYETTQKETITITFSEDISTQPQIAMGPSIINAIRIEVITDCGDADKTTFCFDYNIPPNIDETYTIYIGAAKDSAGNKMQGTANEIDDSHEIKINTKKPRVSSVSSDGRYYTSPGPQTITITFNEDISVAPTISAGQTINSATEQQVGTCEDTDAKTFCFTYNVPDDGEFIITIFISGAKNLADNEMDEDASHRFNIETIDIEYVEHY